MIRVLYIEPGKAPEEKIIGTGLAEMQALVGGIIELFPLEDEMVLICNEEGKINDLPLNRAMVDSDGRLIDIIAGSFFIAAAPADSDTFESLPYKSMQKYKVRFKYPETFIRDSTGHLMIVPIVK
ncbi:MAG: DUF3846 domain-containing protein [Bacillota bacterium]|nr:DUF3846 domain-containing protein [Bacillota bacterium]